HTHAMQFEAFGHSLASLRYPEWSGLYRDGKQYLYVNIGVGCIMLPARFLDATPEITVITLRRKP
ncbi:MAG TPA: metallophosphoesterase, partial [Candidatus Barnesiella excrementipullorum]|nr:metallophosphoesterase [Candidatus Barnesiella excrementipullorum]